MPNYLAVAHIYLKSEDQVTAIAEADDVKLAIERDLLDPDEGEVVDIVEVIDTEENPVPTAAITQLRRARNILLRTRTKDGYDVARSIDEFAHMLSTKLVSTDESRASYDYGNLMAVLKEVLDGGNPLDH